MKGLKQRVHIQLLSGTSDVEQFHLKHIFTKDLCEHFILWGSTAELVCCSHINSFNSQAAALQFSVFLS